MRTYTRDIAAQCKSTPPPPPCDIPLLTYQVDYLHRQVYMDLRRRSCLSLGYHKYPSFKNTGSKHHFSNLEF